MKFERKAAHQWNGGRYLPVVGIARTEEVILRVPQTRRQICLSRSIGDRSDEFLGVVIVGQVVAYAGIEIKQRLAGKPESAPRPRVTAPEVHFAGRVVVVIEIDA